MRAHPLSEKGLSMSQATSVANLCHQRSNEINQQIIVFNNASESVTLNNELIIMVKARPMPEDIFALLTTKAELVSLQAYLMEAVKTKNNWIKKLQEDKYIIPVELIAPEMERVEYPTDIEASVSEEWGWEQLNLSEITDFLIAEAKASQLGQFIHKDGILDKLRKDLATLPDMKWLDKYVGGGVTSLPVKIEKHHKAEDLLAFHEKFAMAHREAEMKVNYYKAKIKNLTSLKNAEIAKSNGDKMATYNEKSAAAQNLYTQQSNFFLNEVKKGKQLFEKTRLDEIRRVSALKIQIPLELQNTLDLFMDKVKEK